MCEYLKRISILVKSLKTRVLSDFKVILGVFQVVNFFDNCHVDRFFLSLAVRKKSSNFTNTLM